MSKRKKDTRQDTASDAQQTEAPVILMIKNEHKYTLMMLSVLREQLADFDIGKTPDYQLMLEVVNYMDSFPDRFNHPTKKALIQAIINTAPENNTDLENLLAEKRQISDLAKEVIQSLKALLKESTILKEEQLKIFCKNYVELIESHIEIESQVLFSRARSELTDEQLHSFSDKLYFEEDHPLSNLVEERYKELSKILSHRLDDWEEAANELALAEFVSMGALFESIEPLSIGMAEISQIIKQYSYRLYMENFQCYKELLTKKQDSPKAYIQQPVDCLMASYKEYVKGLGEIGQVLQKTRDQVLEPYEARKPFYHSKKSKTAKH